MLYNLSMSEKQKDFDAAALFVYGICLLLFITNDEISRYSFEKGIIYFILLVIVLPTIILKLIQKFNK